MPGRLTGRKPALLLLPGLDGTGRLFEPILDPLTSALDGRADVMVVEYPQDKPLRYDELADFARSRLADDTPYWVLGESFGGPLAVRLAAQDKDRCQGVILSASFLRNPQPVLSKMYPLVSWLPESEAVHSVAIRTILGRYSTPALAELLHDVARRLNPLVLNTRLEEIFNTDVSAQMAAITQPSLYLRAQEDWIVPDSASQHLIGQNPRCRVVDFDAPHGLLQVRPDHAASVIGDFIASGGA